MTIKKNIRKALFEVEKTALFIVFLVTFINLAVNGLLVLFDITTSSVYYTQLLSNILLFSFVYFMIYAINQVSTSIPLLVSFNCSGKLLARNIITTGSTRSLIITLLIVLIKVMVFNTGYGLSSIISIFGINLNSSNIIDLLITAGILYILLYFIYSLITLISLLGVSYGWEYVIIAASIILGTCALLFKFIVLLVVFGWQLSSFILLLLIMITIFNVSNYRMIVNFEYKY